MVSDQLNEIYRNVENPLAELQQSDLYKLWEQRSRSTSAETGRKLSILERISKALTDLDSFTAIALPLAIALILTGIILLFIDRMQKNRQKNGNSDRLPVETVTGTIVSVMMRQEGKKSRRYGLVEFNYNGFKYTQGFYLPATSEFEEGKQVTILADPKDIRNSRLKTPFYLNSSPLEGVAQWFVIIGIALLICVLV